MVENCPTTKFLVEEPDEKEKDEKDEDPMKGAFLLHFSRKGSSGGNHPCTCFVPQIGQARCSSAKLPPNRQSIYVPLYIVNHTILIAAGGLVSWLANRLVMSGLN